MYNSPAEDLKLCCISMKLKCLTENVLLCAVKSFARSCWSCTMNGYLHSFLLWLKKKKNALKAIYLRLVLMTFSNARRLLAVRTVAHVRRFFKKFQRGSVCCVSLSTALQPCCQRESEHIFFFFFCHKEDYNVFFKGPFKEVQ